MARRKMEKEVVLDENADIEMTMVQKSAAVGEVEAVNPDIPVPDTKPLVNCLRKEKIFVRHIDKQKGKIRDPKHVLYGGMSENASKVYTVPLLRSGLLCDVLTKEEKDYLERALGLEPNTMSVYKKEHNFWSTANDEGINKVILKKRGNVLDLSNPTDYIKYKILLANKDFIAPSVSALQDCPKATYEFVLESEEESARISKFNMSSKMQSYKEYGKYEENKDVLRFVVETMEGKPLSSNTKLDILQVKINDLIQSDAKLFLKVITDPMLNTKILIRKAVEKGIISKRGNYYYLRDGNLPLCSDNQDPTLSNAAAFLNLPRNQELKFSIEVKVKPED